jgi:DNA repair exonuclease SbcCD nuclease subunit
MQKMELETFDAAMVKCGELGADFVLISGDLFHVGIPDLGVVNSSLKSMMRLQERGIPIYAIYGSHDYTPNGTSVIDILNTAGVLTNVFRPSFSEGRLKLGVTVDEKTGAKLTGVSARKVGLEGKYFDVLDREALEKEEGFKVFLFHSGLTELRPEHLREMNTVSLNSLPRGFDYYAGGHIHQRGEYDLEGFRNVVFPGPLFTGHGADLEATAMGERRGVYFVEFDQRVESKRFVPIGGLDGVFREYDLTGMSAKEARDRVASDLAGVQVEGKLVVIRAYGELAGGKVSDVGLAEIRSSIASKGAVHVYLNRHSLKSREPSEAAAAGQDPSAVERTLFTREVGRVRVASKRLQGEKGASAGMELLRVLRQQPKLGESKRDYSARMTSAGEKILGLEVEAP